MDSVQPSTNLSPTNESQEAHDGKECSNLLILISELYNFQVISSLLVFDIIRGLLEQDLTEFKVELLLKIMRSMDIWSYHLVIVNWIVSLLQIQANSYGKTTLRRWRILYRSYRQRLRPRIALWGGYRQPLCFIVLTPRSSRTSFMVETLANLKNNKLKRNVTQNQGGAAVERMKKFLTGLTKTRHGKLEPYRCITFSSFLF